MGFIEVIFNLKTILGTKICKKRHCSFSTWCNYFIDYQGLICIAKRLRKLVLKHRLLYFATNLGLKGNWIKEIKRDVDKMHVILPFEKEFYDKHHLLPRRSSPLMTSITSPSSISDLSLNNYMKPTLPFTSWK
jgi:lipid-A-disaccharide synthase